MPLVEVGSLRIDLVEAGTGPPVVLAHSSVSGNRQWRKLIERLSPHHRVLAPNLLGYGQTSAWTGPHAQTLDDAAAVLLAVCERVDGPIALVGHSWGGAAALWAARSLGPRVRELVLYEPMLIGLLLGQQRHEAWAEAAAMHADVRRHAGAGDWTALARRFTDYFNGEGAWDATPADRQAVVAAALPPNVHEWEAGAAAIDTRSLASIEARTLLLCGDRTRLVLRETAQVLRDAFPHWAFELLPGCGHMAPLSQAEQVNDRIEAFLARR